MMRLSRRRALRPRAGALVTVMCAAAVAVMAPVGPASGADPVLVSDDFNRSSLAPVPWTVVDPVGDGSVELVGAASGQAVVELGVPAGTSHDPWHVNRALRLMQPVANADFEVEVGFASLPVSGTQMQGLIVEADAGNWLRFDVHHNGTGLRVFAASTVDGVSSSRLSKAFVGSGDGVRVRVARAGDRWTYAYSADGGVTFTTVGSFTRAMAVSSLGPFAANHGLKPAFTARVDWVFDTASPVSPEDPADPALLRTVTTPVVGQGSVTRSPDAASYTVGSVVALSAVPDPGWTFVGWSGDLETAENPTSLTVDGNATVTATFQQDLTPPAISAIGVVPYLTSATVTWTTDEPATSVLSYGLTASVELGTLSSAELLTGHSISIGELQCGMEYHYSLGGADGGGNEAQNRSGTFSTLSCGTSSAPEIDIWYGSPQHFGHNGQPQTWANILGNASDPDGLHGVTYRLNGGPEVGLTTRPDRSTRIARPGDFNAEIAFADLVPGSNTLTIRATDALGNSSTATVEMVYEAGGPWALPTAVDWSEATSIQDVAQVVDGRWELTPDGIRTVETGYDRLIDIGDISWTTYEVTVPVTIHSIPDTGLAGVGVAVGWTGHEGTRQPRVEHPLGALGFYHRSSDTVPLSLKILKDGDGALRTDSTGRQLQPGVTYIFRMRSEPAPTAGEYLYSFKVWEADDPEPVNWTLSGPTAARAGSTLLIAHYMDVTFGDVTITPVSP